MGSKSVQQPDGQEVAARPPEWIRRKWPTGEAASSTLGILRKLVGQRRELNTIAPIIEKLDDPSVTIRTLAVEALGNFEDGKRIMQLSHVDIARFELCPLECLLGSKSDSLQVGRIVAFL